MAANIPFAMAPGLVDDDEIIDYSTTDGKKPYKAATYTLDHEFDCKQENLNLFLFEVDARADQFSWGQVLTILEDAEEENSPEQ